MGRVVPLPNWLCCCFVSSGCEERQAAGRRCPCQKISHRRTACRGTCRRERSRRRAVGHRDLAPKNHLAEVVRPLQLKDETIYVVPGSDAEEYVEKRFPNKSIRHVGQSLRANSIDGFVQGLPVIFQREKAKGLTVTYHFTFTGDDPREVTVAIDDRRLEVTEGHHGKPDLRVSADSTTWIRFLNGHVSIVWALVSRRVKLRGSPKLLLAFSRCFPS